MRSPGRGLVPISGFHQMFTYIHHKIDIRLIYHYQVGRILAFYASHVRIHPILGTSPRMPRSKHSNPDIGREEEAWADRVGVIYARDLGALARGIGHALQSDAPFGELHAGWREGALHPTRESREAREARKAHDPHTSGKLLSSVSSLGQLGMAREPAAIARLVALGAAMLLSLSR
jgi:hypothetical protein